MNRDLPISGRDIRFRARTHLLVYFSFSFLFGLWATPPDAVGDFCCCAELDVEAACCTEAYPDENNCNNDCENLDSQYVDNIFGSDDECPSARGCNSVGSCDFTLVELVSFSAHTVPQGVVVKWKTASELDSAGFNLWRSGNIAGNYEKINDTLIPAEGKPAAGASYEYLDHGCPTADCYYKLEDIDLTGMSTFHGPTGVTPAAEIWRVPSAEASQLGTGTAETSRRFAIYSILLVPAAAIFWLVRRQRQKKGRKS